LGVMSTGRGLVLVWKYDIPNDEDLGDYVDVSTLVCLDDKTDDEVAALLKL
jgi:hypothetical protein